MSLTEEIIHHPMYLLFGLMVLVAVIIIIASLMDPTSTIGQWIFGYFNTLFR
jgi:hypothetical protein